METTTLKKVYLACELTEEYETSKIQITSPQAAYDFLLPLYGDKINVNEMFYVMCLDSQKRVTAYSMISSGNETSTIVSNKMICKIAVDSLATSIIVSHNHPSNKLKPSAADDKITTKIEKCLKNFDIKVDDHIIAASNGYYSYSEEGRMNLCISN